MNLDHFNVTTGLRGKIFLLCIILVITASVAFAAIGIYELRAFMYFVSKTNDSKSDSIKTLSEQTLKEITREGMLGTISLSAQHADGDFWTLRHSFTMLADQVKDIFEHPEYYGERDISAPDLANAGNYALQLIFPDDRTAEDPETMQIVRRLANLEPMMREIVLGNNSYTRDCCIALANGAMLAMDTISSQKVDENGNRHAFDPRVRPWYKMAVEKGSFYFTLAVSSYYAGLPEIEYGMPIYVDGELVAVLQGATLLSVVDEFMTGVGVGRNSFSIIISDDGQLVYSPRKDGELVMHTDESYNIRQTENEQLLQLVADAQFKLGSFGEAEIDGEKYFAAYADMPTVDWVQFTFIPLSEMDRPTVALLTEVDAISTDAERLFKNAFRHSSILILGIALLLLANAFITSMSLSGKILKPINVMKRRIEAVTDDQFVFQMEDIYRTGDEIEVLAKTFVHLSDQREDYLHRILTMTADQERVRTELSIASHIQTNMLPSVFPPFPERHEFDLFASMHPAKEVGGDFYDFLMVDDNHLAVVIADVSDKGVPAALFMTSAKILINYRAQLGGSPAEILKAANDQLCQNNEDMMFVTVWLGILELSTGKMICSNAGHEYPIMRGPDGTFRVVKDKHGMPLGIMSQSVFQDYELQMMPGSAVFVYTDGVPEAKNAEGTFYGMQKLQDTLNHLSGAKPEEILEEVKVNVQTFVGNARQFDDMTMLCLEYHGKTES